MQEVVDLLAGEYGWSDSVSNRPDKLQRESLRSTEAVQLAEVLDYEIEAFGNGKTAVCDPSFRQVQRPGHFI